MSFLKTIKTQLGISSTPANNFVLDASAANGTMKVSRGNVEGTTQDVITVDAAGKVAFPSGVSGIGSIHMTAQELTSGTFKDFSIPPSVIRITLSWSAISVSGTSPFRIQIGTGGSPKTTGYIGVSGDISTGGAGATTYVGAGFDFRTQVAASTNGGNVILALVDPSTNLWSANGQGFASSNSLANTAGYNSLSGVLDIIRFTTINGTDTFDLAGGYVNVIYDYYRGGI